MHRRPRSTRSSGWSVLMKTCCAISPSGSRSSKRVTPPGCAGRSAIATATTAGATGVIASETVAIASETGAIAATVVTVRATGVRARPPTKLKRRRRRRNNHGNVTARRRWRRTPAVLSPPQELPVLWRQCAEDRLQGRQALAALRVGARQDRSEPHHRGFGEEAARARPSDQACALPWAFALRNPVMTIQRPCPDATEA